MGGSGDGGQGEEDNSKREELEQVESWLDEHPVFVADYFSRKASRAMVDAWLLSRSTPHAVQPPPNPGSGSSGAATPVRKISAHEFERSGILRPIVNTTAEGLPTFLPLLMPPQGGEGASRRRRHNELRALDERELIFELVKDICNELEIRSLCHKILQNVSILTDADRCSLFLVRGEKGHREKRPILRLINSFLPCCAMFKFLKKLNVHSSIKCRSRLVSVAFCAKEGR